MFNLSAERSYDPELMGQRVIQMGFPGTNRLVIDQFLHRFDLFSADHHAPPLTLLFKILLRVYAYLKEDDENVACIHCLAGRGRTGSVIVSYLVFSSAHSGPSLMEFLPYFFSSFSHVAKCHGSV